MPRYIRDLGDGKHAVECPWDSEHTTGERGDTSTIIFDGSNGRPEGFKCQHSHCSHRTAADVLEFFGVSPQFEKSMSAEQDHMDREKKGFNFKSLKDLFDEPEELVPWLVDQLLITGGTSILAAKPKAGKTTISTQCALAVARGESFLGKSTVKGPVLHIAVEEKKSEVIRRYRDQGATGTEQIYVHTTSSPHDAVSLLKSAILEYKPVFVIVDTLFKVVKVENGNDYSEVIKALEPLQILARELNTHIMMVHHLGKSEREGADSLLGSTGISGSTDNVIVITKKENLRTIKTVPRYGEEIEETNLVFDPETRRTMLGSTKKADSFADLSAEILEFLKTSDGPMKSTNILSGVGGNKGKFFAVLKAMTSSGVLLKTGQGGKGDPARYSPNPNPPMPHDDY